LALGDNFYDDGVQSFNDSQWNESWASVYHGMHDNLAMKWYGVVGNHDWGYGWTGVQAQIDRTTATDDDLWEMPSTNYTRIVQLTGDQGSLVIVAIDTTTLAPSENNCCGEDKWDNVTIQRRIDEQLRRTEEGLEYAWVNAPRPMWIIVMGHYPIFSVGEHGDTDELVAYLNPLRDKYKVHAYVAGHDHFSAHMSMACNDSNIAATSGSWSCDVNGDRWKTQHFIAGGGVIVKLLTAPLCARNIICHCRLTPSADSDSHSSPTLCHLHPRHSRITARRRALLRRIGQAWVTPASLLCL
jgi:hypothetical protein